VDGAYLVADTLGNQNGASLAMDVQLSGDVVLTNGSVLFADLGGAGHAGEIQVSGNNVEISNGAVIVSRASPGTTGDPGSLEITAIEQVSLTAGGSVIRTEQVDNAARGGHIGLTAPIISLTNGALVDASGNKGGAVVIKGDQLTVDNAAIFADTLGNVNGSARAIDIQLTGYAHITNGSGVIADVVGAGRAGEIQVSGNNVEISNGALLGSRAFRGSTGNGGRINILTGDLLLNSNAVITTAAAGTGTAGDVVVTAQNVTIAGGASINSSTYGSGQGGSLQIVATDSVTVSDHGSFPELFTAAVGISAGSGSAGDVLVTARAITVTDGAGVGSTTTGLGQGGSLQIMATDSVTISGTTPDGSLGTQLFANATGKMAEAGAAGNIVITAQKVTVADGANVISATTGRGNGGSLIVTARDTVTVAGTSANGTLASGLNAQTLGTETGAGAAGALTVTAQNVIITDGAQVSTLTNGRGNGGSLIVTAGDTVTVAGTSANGTLGSSLNSATLSTETGAGGAGALTVTARNVIVTDGGQVDGGTKGAGHGGTVTVTASDTIEVSGRSANGKFGSHLASSSGDNIGAGTGDAGNVVVTGRNVKITGGAEIQSSTFGPGQGGNVVVAATETVLISGRGNGNASKLSVSTESGVPGAGAAGTITVTAPNITVSEGGQISSSSFGAGQGGMVTVTASELVAVMGGDGESPTGLFSTAGGIGTVAGNAGDIQVTALDVSVLQGGVISSSSSGIGNGGTVQITATDTVRISGTTNDGIHVSVVSAGTEGMGAVAGDAGNVVITAPHLSVTGGGKISSSTFGPGQGGSVRLNVESLALTNGAQITSSSSLVGPAAGRAGAITIQGLNGPGSSATSLSLDNSTITTTIAGGTSLSIPATIDLTAQTIALANGAKIQADTSGAAPAGAIVANGGTLAMTTGAQITSGSTLVDPAAGSAGALTIQGVNGPGSSATSVSLDNITLSTTISGGSAASVPATIAITADTVAVTNGTQINAETSGAAPAGDIALNVGTLRANVNADGTAIKNTRFDFISSESNGPGPAGTVAISGLGKEPTDAATLVALNSTAISTTVRDGTAATRPATITITADTVALSNDTEIRASTEGAAPAGNIAFHVNTLRANVNPDGTPIEGALPLFILSQSNRPDSGPAGTVAISGLGKEPTDAATLVALNSTTISTAVIGGTAATRPATITITADTVALSNSTQILASTEGAAPAGNIAFHVNTLRANVNPDGTPIKDTRFDFISSGSNSLDSTAGRPGAITVSGLGKESTDAATLVALSSTTISTMVQGGTVHTSPGTITMTTDTLSVANGGQIKADTRGAAPAGNIVLSVNNLTGDQATISSSSTSNVPDVGNAGAIMIQGVNGPGSSATSVSFDNSTINTTISGGNATTTPATIAITARTVNLTNGTQVKADTSGSAPAGAVTLTANGSIALTDDSRVSSSSFLGTGNAGSVTLQLAGLFSSQSSTVSSSAAQGAGGNVSITGGIMQLTDGTRIEAATDGSKNAGSITLTSASDLLMRDSTITTSATQASGGSIKLTSPNLIRLVDSTITSSVQGQTGSNGGNINIDPQLVVIQNSQLLANANAGAGGNITIAASGAVLIDPNSRLSATAGPAGVSGSVNINSPIQVLSGTLGPLKLAYSQAGLSGDRCAADPTGQFSSFVQAGRDGVPQIPGALSPSPLSFLDTLTSGSWGSQVPSVAAARLGLDSVSYDNSTLFRFHSACRS
jgi:large exoprotein involved in heme utilization and adhesion